MQLKNLLGRTTLALLLAAPLQAEAQTPEISNRDLFEKSLEAAVQAMEFYGPYDNPEELRRINDIAFRVAQETGFDEFPFSFFLVDIPVPNAFALPGGQIFLTRGMLELGASDEMLAGLLGHEIGHVVMQHGTRMQKRATLLNVLSNVLLAGVIIAADGSGDQSPRYDPRDPYSGRSDSGDRVMGVAAAGVVVSELLLRSYSRDFEDEADDEGQRYAAAAGYDPGGYQELMDLMRARLPESKEYGYWRTHPFFDNRVKAAEVRKGLLKIQEPNSTDEFREATQKTLLAFEPRKPERISFLETAALNAWPQGSEAERIRLARLHQARDTEFEHPPLAQDFGELLETYGKQVNEVRAITPESEFLTALETEIKGLDKKRVALYAKTREVFLSGVFETDFLETFLSNFPEAVELPAIAQTLGDAYARLQRFEDAVSLYLKAWKADPDSEAGMRAQRGLRNLASSLEELGALQMLVDESHDADVQILARGKLNKSAAEFEELSNGAKFLKRYPESKLAPVVTERVNLLANNLYGEAILYQKVGDHGKALERINKILTEAPYSPAAEKLRHNAVLES